MTNPAIAPPIKEGMSKITIIYGLALSGLIIDENN
jgi:hypothetical protein